MHKKAVYWALFGVCAVAMTAIQFIPSTPVLVPVQLPEGQRAENRLVNFEGIDNFRDLGGYPTAAGETVKWGSLYRSANLSEASRSDQQALLDMELDTLIDLRSSAEKEAEPNQLPDDLPFKVIEIPVLDGGAMGLADEITARIDDGSLAEFDAEEFMLSANRQFADDFTPQFAEFIQAVLQAQGRAVVWHCTAGKDRAGFAAAILLRILGVPQEVVMDDYALSKQYSLDAHSRDLLLLKLFKGEEVADKVAVLLGVEKPWLQAAFDQIDRRWGSFDQYVEAGLQLTQEDITKLRAQLLE
ncbi:tyrosine-protein phosphatase [Pseudohalioglobus lutimaris]|uniref:tyrosine-protein phosphatase n=1 Tax=Pseudohalioglobus lutimaris TaxID=1737061 RepID=UPI0013FD6F5E|nr:tyrosine-protein phosphatase [Pseudohalioglobus lutimaris]